MEELQERHLPEVVPTISKNIEMASKLQSVVLQAIKTFRISDKKLTEPLQNEMDKLKTMVDDIKLKDVMVPKFLLEKTEVQDFMGIKLRKVHPIRYMQIYEDSDISIGVFVLQQGAKIPIHDHPCMYGILKVLQGIIKVNNYSVAGLDKSTEVNGSSFFYQHPLKVIKHPETTTTENDGCCTLTPTERNIHEVECINGPAAFLDILSPPYEDNSHSKPRGCHYFEEMKENKTNDGYVRLLQISDPIYWATPSEENENTSTK